MNLFHFFRVCVSEENGAGDANRSHKQSQGFGLLPDLHTYGGSGSRIAWKEAVGGAGTEMFAVRFEAGCRVGHSVPKRGVNKSFTGVVPRAGFWDTRISGHETQSAT